MTRGKLISDIELRLSGGKPSDDFELSRSQVGHWLDVVRDELVQLYLNDTIKRTGLIDSTYVIKEVCKVVTKEDLACVSNDLDRSFFTLTSTPMSLVKDMGVVKVVTDEYELVYPADINMITTISDLPFARPSETTLVYSREKDKIYVEGINDNIVSDPSFIVYYVPIYENSSLSEDSEFVISNELVALLLDRVEEIARRQMQRTVQDNDNNSLDEVA